MAQRNTFARKLPPPPPGTRVALAVSRFNADVTEPLLDAAVASLTAAGLDAGRIEVLRVPGAFELPLAADRLAASGRFAAVIALGAVIKGETSHDRHIATAVAIGIEQTARARGLPVVFGVLTCDSLEQARERSGGRHGNKGREAAEAALEMIAALAAVSSAGES